MKTILFTFALPLALCAAVGATAQTKSMTSAPKADSVMLSEITDGDYLVRRYKVTRGDDAEYPLYYKISTWNIDTKYDGNNRAMNELSDFMASFDRDSLMRVHSATVTGYASPDGPVALNTKLAKGRAQSLMEYADKKFGLAKKYHATVNSVVSNWMDARAAIATSSIPDKQQVLAIIDRKLPDAQTERQLKAMPEAWKYLADNVLPPMRYAELTVTYTDAHIAEVRTFIPRPEPEVVIVEEECDPCDCIDVMASVSGLIVEMPDVPTDYDKMSCRERREMHRAEKANLRAMDANLRAAEKMARKDARLAEKMARKEAKIAEKMARENARQIRKAS